MEDYHDDDFPRQLTKGELQKRATAWAKKLAKQHITLAPVPAIDGTKLVTSFWGKAWCKHMESLQDADFRLARGRSYVRNGAIIDLHFNDGKVRAQVVGNELYHVVINFKAMSKKRWQVFIASSGQCIGSLVELLSGKVPEKVARLIVEEKTGLFPARHEISYNCSCLDDADLCKHIAAVLYGIGLRFDVHPELFFSLRNVDPRDLLTRLGDSLKAGTAAQADSNLSELFDIDILETP
ncbi:SWIM zinc finger family protein [archaeon]|nr:SWIM zinc finger family protein [archaeon]